MKKIFFLFFFLFKNLIKKKNIFPSHKTNKYTLTLFLEKKNIKIIKKNLLFKCFFL
jgi:hypothetical protein